MVRELDSTPVFWGLSQIRSRSGHPNRCAYTSELLYLSWTNLGNYRFSASLRRLLTPTHFRTRVFLHFAESLFKVREFAANIHGRYCGALDSPTVTGAFRHLGLEPVEPAIGELSSEQVAVTRTD